MIGFGNAHSFKPRKGKYRAKKEEWNDMHKKMDAYPYDFSTASHLMEEFC